MRRADSETPKVRGVKARKKTEWSQNIVTWGDDDTLNISVVFTWHLARAKAAANAWRRVHPNGRVVAGGPAVKLLGAPWADETPETTPVDVLAMHNPDATFTTRGCLRKCKFCAVPKIEGSLRELKTWKRVPIICDNNILAASKEHFARVIQSLQGVRGVDFNQGLDARLLTTWHAEQLATLGKSTVIRFALDHSSSQDAVGKAVELVRSVGFREIRVYVLIGFHDSPDDAIARLKFARSLQDLTSSPMFRVCTYPMRYQPLDACQKNTHIEPEWSEQEMQDVKRYFYQAQTANLGISLGEYTAKFSLSRISRNETQFDRMKRRARRLGRKEL